MVGLLNVAWYDKVRVLVGYVKPAVATKNTHHIDIDHVGTQSSSAGCVMLMKQLFMAAGFWALFFFLFLVATGFYPFYHCRISAHACGPNIPHQHLSLTEAWLTFVPGFYWQQWP